MPQHALGGHYGAVVDIGWGVDGGCLQTVSEDQTSRIFTACGGHWCEIARPQVQHSLLPVSKIIILHSNHQTGYIRHVACSHTCNDSQDRSRRGEQGNGCGADTWA